MRRLEAWVEEPGIGKLEPFGEPSPARGAMVPEVSEEEERLKALELAGRPITTPETIREALKPIPGIPVEGIIEAAKGTLAQVTEESAPLLHAAITGETVPQAALSLGAGMLGFVDRVVTQVQSMVQQAATQGEVDWDVVQALGEAKQELWRYDPTDPGAQVATQFVAAIPFGVKTAFHVLADQFRDSPNIEAGIRTAGDLAELGAFGQVFKTLQAPLRPKAKPFIEPAPEPVTKLRKGGRVSKKEISPEAQKLADEILKEMGVEKVGEPKVIKRVKRAEPVAAPKEEPAPKVTPLEKILEEPKAEPVPNFTELAEARGTDPTGEALRWGKEASPEQIELAKARRIELQEQATLAREEAMAAPKGPERAKKLEGAGPPAFEAQFVREAIEASEGRHPTQVKVTPAEKVVETQRAKEVAKREGEAKAVPIKEKRGRPKKEGAPPEPPREEPTIVTSEGIKAETAEALKGKTHEEAYEILRGIIEEFEDNPKYRFEDPFELTNFREWTDELSGKIVERIRKEGVVPEPEVKPPTTTLDFGGFQKMYESLVERIKGDQPLATKADEIVRKGEVVKQRRSKNRTFPPVYELEVEILKNAKTLGETWLHRAFENPVRAFEEAGERFKSLTTHPYHQAEKSFFLAWRGARREIKALERSIPRRSRRRVMVHAISKQKRGEGLLKATGVKEIPELTPKEMEVYNALRQRYENLYRRMNQVRKAIGVEEFPKEEDYFTFFRDLSAMERMGFRPLHMSNEILNAQFVKMRARPFPFAKPRTGGIYRLELDPFFVLKNYEQKALRYMHISPLVSKLREYQLTMPDGWKLANENPVLAKYLNEWTNFIAGQKPVWSLPPVVEGMMMRINSNLAASILGANARSAAIQVTALRNTITEIGFGYTAKGIESLIHPGRRNFAMRKSKVLLQRTYDVTVEDALSSIRRGKIGAVQRGAARAAMKPLQILDIETAKATWQGAYEFAVKEMKLGEKKSINFADDLVTRTQASAMPGDIAPIQRPVVGRFLTLFQTFTINDWNFLLRDVLGIRNAEVGKGKAFVKTMRYIAATTMFNILFEDILHINSPFPTPIRAFKESVDRGDDLPSLAVNVGSEFIEPIPMIGAARYGKGPVGPAVELIQETIKHLKQDPMARPGGELFGQWIGLPGTAQYGKMSRARERGETLYGQIMGAYTAEEFRPSRPTREIRPTR